MEEIQKKISETERMETDEINELAEKYSIAAANGNKTEKKHCWGKLYTKVFGCEFGNGKSILYGKLNNLVKHFGYADALKKNESNPAFTKINDLFTDALFKYDHTKGSFYGFVINSFKNSLLDEEKSKNTIRIKKDADGNIVTDEKGKAVKEKTVRNNTKYDENGNAVLDDIPDDEIYNPETNFAKKELVEYTFENLLAKINLFLSHKNSKQSNPTRRSYFRIFYTEKIINLINDYCTTDFISNTAEAYECSDKDFVRFVSFSDYKNIDDILMLRFKKFSDIMDDFKEDKLICTPFENIVVQKYRFRYGLDEKEVSSANITIQRKHFETFINDLRQVISDDIKEQIC